MLLGQNISSFFPQLQLFMGIFVEDNFSTAFFFVTQTKKKHGESDFLVNPRLSFLRFPQTTPSTKRKKRTPGNHGTNRPTSFFGSADAPGRNPEAMTFAFCLLFAAEWWISSNLPMDGSMKVLILIWVDFCGNVFLVEWYGKKSTPWKINMDHNHGGLEDHFPF